MFITRSTIIPLHTAVANLFKSMHKPVAITKHAWESLGQFEAAGSLNIPEHLSDGGSDTELFWTDSRTREDRACDKPPLRRFPPVTVFSPSSSGVSADFHRNISSSLDLILLSRRISHHYIPKNWPRWPTRAPISNASFSEGLNQKRNTRLFRNQDRYMTVSTRPESCYRITDLD